MRPVLKQAIIMAVVTFFITLPILGVKIEQSANGLSLTGSWMHSVYAALAVFIVNLCLPVLRLSKRVNPRFQPSRYLESHRGWVLAVLIVIGCLVPFLGSRATIDIATLALIYVLLGLGLNVVVGFAGLLDLGYVGFYAVGAYTYALIASHYGISFWWVLPIAAVLSGIVGILLGFPVLRLRGDYLAIVTLGFGEIIRIMLNNLDQYTNGPLGISSIPAPNLFNIVFTRRAEEGQTPFHEWLGISYSSEYRLIFLYVIIFALCLIALWVINRLVRMPVGRAWEALREDEIACRSLGLNPTTVKLSAFAIGALFAGVAGAFFAAKQGFINPESFTFIESAIVLAIVVLGGMGSQIGVILAAIALTIIPELAREFSEYRMLIFGAVMVLMMVWRPQGLIPAQRPKMELPE
ncbi:high-affinity branched-chain amino acid ABC transporter permease LivM [Suttonella sp. R2A3]|uniref:high-affinity branched-chain amino acid ABC transporter permease LivM n=1 Tax=Suttonella sp. R2A3 TaxID=2908648 RepID=UPI001F3CFAE1|nr:high-affinity branched-chain amino acid ABC transporter permease LivM [Suttonella sp. R2A3]UJF24373.1 high-affinity branched-chain amino acid ABC transporter permease LivM [Suttonella sp. R2A3]